MHTSNQTAKQLSELGFWTSEYLNIGQAPTRFDDPASRYIEQLGVARDTFAGQIVIDIGCGPVGALSSFAARLKFGVDVLARSYPPFGTPAHNLIYLAAPAEDLPFVDNFADAVVSLNALDHVDDFEAAIREIHRVLKVDGRIFLGLNLLHRPTLQEPQWLTEERVLAAMAGLFDVTQVQVIPLATEDTIQAPGGVLSVQARRLPAPPSTHQQVTLDTIRHLGDEQWFQHELPGFSLQRAVRPWNLVGPQTLGTTVSAVYRPHRVLVGHTAPLSGQQFRHFKQDLHLRPPFHVH